MLIKVIAISTFLIAFLLIQIIEKLSKAMRDEANVSAELIAVYKAIAKQNQILIEQNQLIRKQND